MEEAEKSLESKEDRLKNGTDPPDGAIKVSTEIKNGDGNKMEDVKSYGDENNSSEELKEARNALDGKEKEDGDSQDTEEKKNLEETKDVEKKKEVKVQNGNDMKFVVKRNDEEVNRVLERVEDARDKKSMEAVEDVKFNNEKYGFGDVEDIGGKSKQEESNQIDDISAKEMRNGKNEGVEEMKDHEHGKPISSEKDEDIILVQGEENDGGKDRKEVKDMEMVETEDVVEKEAPDVKDEGKLVVSKGEEEKQENGGNAEKTVGDNEKIKSLKRKRSIGRAPSEIGEAKKNGDTREIVEEMEVKGSRKRSKEVSQEVLSSPVVSSNDRPVREKKTIERLVEIIEKGPDSTVIIEKGRGTPLREIPNVAYNLARNKPAELKLLHQTLFGRKGKAVDYKSNLLQFSGFAWHESEEKQRAKIKEKLDKCVKETLLELCDLLDLTVSKTNTKKDEIIAKVLDFLEAPQAMINAVHAEKSSSKSRKRERAPTVDASKSSRGTSKKRSRQKHEKTEGTPNSDVKSSHYTEKDDEDKDSEEDEGEDSEEQFQKEDEVPGHCESDAEEKDLEVGDEDEDEVHAGLRKGKQVKKSSKGKEKQDVKKSPKKQASSNTVTRKIGRNSKKTSPKTDGKSSLKTPSSKQQKDEKSNKTGENSSRKKKDAESPKKSNSKSNSKKKSSGKASKSKSKSGEEQKPGPTKEELRSSILEILKQVDFNTATFTDILKQLDSEYKTDLTPRKDAIKVMIHELLTEMAGEDEESQDEEEMQ